MKHILFIIAAIFSMVFSADVLAQQPKKPTSVVVFSTNIHCDNCKRKIEGNIPFEKGVKDLKVDLSTKTVTVTFRSDKTNSEALLSALTKLGYKALIKEERAVKD